MVDVSKMARSARFERATVCLEGRCSIQLSYERNRSSDDRKLPQSGMLHLHAKVNVNLASAALVRKSLAGLFKRPYPHAQ